MTGAMPESVPEHSPRRDVDPSSSPGSESPPTVAKEVQPGVAEQHEGEVVPKDSAGQVSDNGETGTGGAVESEGERGEPKVGDDEEEEKEEEEEVGEKDSEESEDDEDGEEDDEDGEEEDEEEVEEEEEEEEEEDEEDEDDEDDEEPRLKYARLTQHLGGVYRNGDATSAFLVAGDKMVRLDFCSHPRSFCC